MKELVAIVERGKGKNNYSCFCPEKVGKYHLARYRKNSREAKALREFLYHHGKKFTLRLDCGIKIW